MDDLVLDIDRYRYDIDRDPWGLWEPRRVGQGILWPWYSRVA